MRRMSNTTTSGPESFYEGWATYQGLVLDALRDLTPEQLGLRTAPHRWAVWQLAAHVAGSRAYWFHDVLGEGDPATRDLFRVNSTTVPDLPLEDAGWEDDEDHPRSAAEIVEAFGLTWDMIEDCLRRWTPDDLTAEFSRERRSSTETVTRQLVIWHLVEHDLHHGGGISQILGSHGVPAPNL